MDIHFTETRWPAVHDTYAGWWAHTLDRPVLNITLTGAPAKAERPAGYQNQPLWRYGPGADVDKVLEDAAYTLATQRYAADGYPMLLPDYGAGVNAAFCGCRTLVRDETVWFLPPEGELAVEALHLQHRPGSPEYALLREFYQKAARRFNGRVVLGMTHLNNGIDIASRFLEAEALNLALIDAPEQVKRLIDENHALCNGYLEVFTRDMAPAPPGYSCWGGLLGAASWMGTQSDFCAMIGTEMFEEFILPELAQCWREQPAANYYHLDGPGQLRHLDSILANEDLRCVQWVPGDGAPLAREWPGVYNKIRAAGKNIWYMGTLEEMVPLAQELGSGAGLYWQGEVPWDRAEDARRICGQLGVPFGL